MLCIQRNFSTNLSYKEWLLVILLLSPGKTVWPLSSAFWLQKSIFTQRTAPHCVYFIFFGSFSVNPIHVPSRSVILEIFKPVCLALNIMPHPKSHHPPSFVLDLNLNQVVLTMSISLNALNYGM